MTIKLKVGDKVRSARSTRYNVTVDKLYEVKGIEGDVDYACGGEIEVDAFIFIADDNKWGYSRFPHSRFNDWELITD